MTQNGRRRGYMGKHIYLEINFLFLNLAGVLIKQTGILNEPHSPSANLKKQGTIAVASFIKLVCIYRFV
jgi:hypothetical protein